jgi:hypothetical protein
MTGIIAEQSLIDQNKRLWELLDDKCRELHNAYNKIAPTLNLKPFHGTCNKEQVIWAKTQDQANSLRAGEDIFTFVKQELEKV